MNFHDRPPFLRTIEHETSADRKLDNLLIKVGAISLIVMALCVLWLIWAPSWLPVQVGLSAMLIMYVAKEIYGVGK